MNMKYIQPWDGTPGRYPKGSFESAYQDFYQQLLVVQALAPAEVMRVDNLIYSLEHIRAGLCVSIDEIPVP